MLASGEPRPRERRRAPGPVLGDPRRRRQLRRRHVVPVPAARGRHGLRRPDVLAGRAERRGARGLPRVPPRRAARAQRLLRVPHRAAGAAVPGGDPPAQACAAIVWCYVGGEAEAAAAMAPMLDAAARAAHARRRSRCRTRRCRARSTGSTRPATSGTGGPTSSRRSPTRRSTIHARFGADDADAASRRCTSTRSTAPPTIALRPTRRGATATRRWGAVFAGVDPDPANVERRSGSGAIDYLEALHPYSAGGAYVNMMMDEGQERVRASYRDNYDRLARIKADLRPRQPVPRQPEHRTCELGPPQGA